MNASAASLTVTILIAALWGCSSGDSSKGTGSSAVACRQKDDADNNSDCAAHAGKSRKLDCDLPSHTDQAIAAGCVREKDGASDVCCPPTVSGQVETSIACTEPADTLTDSDCAGTAQGRKLDCATSQQQQQGLALGCRAESPGSSSDFDLCCPTHVRGGG
jgi:hypothetical protein